MLWLEIDAADPRSDPSGYNNIAAIDPEGNLKYGAMLVLIYPTIKVMMKPEDMLRDHKHA